MLVVIQSLLPSLILIVALYLQRVLSCRHSLQHLSHLLAVGDILSLQHTDAVLLERLSVYLPSVGILVEGRILNKCCEVELTRFGFTVLQQRAERSHKRLTCSCDSLFACTGVFVNCHRSRIGFVESGMFLCLSCNRLACIGLCDEVFDRLNILSLCLFLHLCADVRQSEVVKSCVGDTLTACCYFVADTYGEFAIIADRYLQLIVVHVTFERISKSR